MSKQEFCWSCGKRCATCSGCYTDPCCDNPSPAVNKKPNVILPHCGNEIDLDDKTLDSLYSTEPNPKAKYTCCNCNMPFTNSIQEWITGPCPYCGAVGGNGEIPQQ